MQSKFTHLIFIFAVLFASCSNGDNSLQYSTLNYNDSIYNKKFNLNYTFDGAIQLPKSSDENIDINIVHDSIIDNILGEKYTSSHTQKPLKAYSDTSFNQILNDIKDIRPYNHEDEEDDFSYPHTYEYDIKGEIMFNLDSLIFYRSSFSSYTGGAHGMEIVSNYVFNIIDGKQLSEKDIFIPNYEITLHKLLVKYGYEQYPDSIFIDNNLIVPNGNISLTAHKISYTYNPYEIAPYCCGVIDIKIPFEALINICDSTTLLGSYIINHFDREQ